MRLPFLLMSLVSFPLYVIAQPSAHVLGFQQAADPVSGAQTINPPKGTGLCWALAGEASWKRLVPIAVELNRHTGSNIAGGLAGQMFYKPKVTFEVPGNRADTRLDGHVAHFFLRLHRGELDSLDSKVIDVDVILVRAHVQKVAEYWSR